MKKKTVQNRYVEREAFIIEMNAKNEAYAFILKKGLLAEFKQFHDNLVREQRTGYETAIETLTAMADGASVKQPTPAPKKQPEQAEEAETENNPK